MIEVVSFLGGALVRLITGGIDLFQKKQENTHELALLEKQLQIETIRGQEKRAEIAAQGQADVDVEWSKALNVALASTNAPTGNWFIDGLNSSVRPILTYWWCLVLYTTSKGFIIYAAMQESTKPKEMANLVVTDFDTTIIGSIMGFWFTDRALRYVASRR